MPWARQSKPQLLQYLKQMPKDTDMDLATIQWFGRPKVRKVKLGEIEMTRERLGCVNTIVRDGRNGPPKHKFYIDWRKSPAAVKEPAAISEIGSMIKKWQEEDVRKAMQIKKQAQIAETWGNGKM